MASTATLLELRNLVRERCDQQGSARITDAQVTAAVNRSIKKLHGIITLAAEDDFTTTGTIATVAGTDTYALDASFMKLRHLSAMVDGIEVPISRFQLQERARYQNANGWTRGGPLAYRLIGKVGSGSPADRIVFLPTPSGVYTITYWYVPAPTLLVADADIYDGRSGFEEWIAWDAAIGFLVAEESDVRDAVAERDRVMAQLVMPMIVVRDEARPERVVDVESASDEGPWGAL